MFFTARKEIRFLTEENLRLKEEKECLFELNSIKQDEILKLKKTIKEKNKELKRLKYILRKEKSFG